MHRGRTRSRGRMKPCRAEIPNGIIGTVLAAAIALSVQIGVQFSSLRSEQAGIRTDMRNEHAEIRADMRRMDDRLRAVEVEFGKVDQRLATLERLHLPTPASPAID